MNTPPARAIILAAGRGSRLRPLTDTTPKPLVPAGEKTLIEHGLSLLKAHGINDVVINVHHLREKILAALGDGSQLGMRLHYSIEEELLDSGGGIRQAAECMSREAPDADLDAPLLVLNADVVTDVSLTKLLQEHQQSRAGITLVLRDDPKAASYGLFGIDAENRIRRFLGEGDPAAGLREYMFASVQVLQPEVLDRMPPAGPFSTMRGLYPELFAQGLAFQGFVHTGRWYTSDTPEDLQSLEAGLRRDGPLVFHQK